MNKIICLKPVLIKRLFTILFIFSIPFCTLAFLFAPIDKSFVYMLCMLIVFVLIFVIFYMNRFSLDRIQVNETNEITFYYQNKMLFKTLPFTILVKDIIIEGYSKEIRLKSSSNKMLAIIQNTSISQEDMSYLRDIIKR